MSSKRAIKKKNERQQQQQQQQQLQPVVLPPPPIIQPPPDHSARLNERIQRLREEGELIFMRINQSLQVPYTKEEALRDRERLQNAIGELEALINEAKIGGINYQPDVRLDITFEEKVKENLKNLDIRAKNLQSVAVLIQRRFEG